MTQEATKQKPSTIVEMTEYFDLAKRAKQRLEAAVTDDIVKQLTWPTLRSLAFACRDPKTTAKGITLSQKVMMYRKYDKLWESIAEAVKVYGIIYKRRKSVLVRIINQQNPAIKITQNKML